MADPAIQYEDGGPDTSVLAPTRLTGSGSVIPGSSSGDSILPDTNPVMSALSKAADRKLGEDSYLRDVYETKLDKDRARMEQAFKQESATADDAASLQPWNADQQRADRVRGPLEQFGSFSTIFAIAASAFTKTPAISAMNAAAASMNAMRQGDELGYRSAYEAWKTNTELVQKRFNMERAVYDDASKLATTDLSTWQQKMSIAATQFQDEKLKVMIDNGMVAEVFQTLDSRAKAVDGMTKALSDQDDFHLIHDNARDKVQQWQQEHPAPDANASREEKLQYGLAERAVERQALLDAKRQVAQSKSTARGGLNPNQQQYELIRQKYEGDPDAEEKIANEYATFIRNQKTAGSSGTKSGTPSDDNAKMDSDIRGEHPDWANSQVIEERNRRIKASKESTRPTVQSENAKTLADHKTDIAAEHPDWPKSKVDDEANRRIAQSKQVITGNRADDLRGQIGRIDRANELIDRVEGLMKTNRMITGLGGKISRGEEVVGNVLGGSNSTVYNEFKSDVRLLQEWWERLENNALTQGRPLSAAEKRVGDIIPGLNMGDTVQHTADQLLRIKKIFTEMRQENEGRLGGAAPSSEKPAPARPTAAPWASDPVVGR